jgi:hypothetical protein
MEYIKAMSETLFPGRSVYVKWRGGGLYKAVVQEHIVQRRSSRVKFEDGVSRIVTWKDISFEE